MAPAILRRPQRGLRRGLRERGSVAIMAGLSIAVVVGFAGLALDLGRLYINRSELQTAADACALAAAAELGCPAGGASCLVAAEAAGQFAAQRNRRDFQRSVATIPAADIRFSTTFTPNGSYATRTGANAASTYAMCIARAQGIVPWFMGVLGVGASTVNAQAVASSLPGAAICPNAPIGICPRAGGGGYSTNAWLAAQASNASDPTLIDASGGAIQGTFRWIDYDPPDGGTNEVRDRLLGTNRVCEVRINGTVQESGVKQGSKSAYNTRFGIYPNGGGSAQVQAAVTPPDRSGFAYPDTVTGASPGGDRYPDYRARQAAGTAFQGVASGNGGGNGGGNGNGNGNSGGYVPQGAGGGNVNGVYATTAIHQSLGTNSRVITVPILSACAPGVDNRPTVTSFGCLLMLNPMSNGSTSTVYLQYLGAANASGSPCNSGGMPGNVAGAGGRVPTLVQ